MKTHSDDPAYLSLSKEQWEMLIVSKALLGLLKDPFNIGIAQHMAREFLIRTAHDDANQLIAVGKEAQT